MTDATINRFVASGTAAERAAFTPVPPTPASGPAQGYIWIEEDTDHLYVRDDAAGAYIGPIGHTGSQAWTAVISPSQITSDQNDYNPTSLSTAACLRLNSDASRNVTGLQGGASGRLLAIYNVGSNAIVLKDESASSSAANRFALDSDLTLSGDTSCVLQYDGTSSRWRLIALGKAGVSAAVGGGSGATDNVIIRADGTGGATIQGGGVVTLSDAGALGFPDDVRQTFNPGANAAGLNVGSVASAPGTPSNGDVWYDSATNDLRGHVNSVTVSLGPGVLSAAYSSVGTPANTTETDLQSYAMPGGTLGVDGQVLRVRAAGALAATTRSRTVRLYVGATVVSSVAMSANTTTLWTAEALIIRTGAATQTVYAIFTPGGSAAASVTSTRTTTTETLSGSVTIKVTGQVGGTPVANDITCDLLIAEKLTT